MDSTLADKVLKKTLLDLQKRFPIQMSGGLSLRLSIRPGRQELLLTGCLTELTWTPKIQTKYLDTKHQLADILTKGNFLHT